MVFVRKKFFVLPLSLVIPFFLCCRMMPHGGQPLRFPGTLSRLASPDSRHVLINADSESVSPSGDSHALYLQNPKTGEHKEIYSYGRYVEVLWSPGGGKLLINDYAGSDYSLPVIFLTDSDKTVNIAEEIRKKLGNSRSISGNHHVYITGTEWLTENSLKIRICGYGDIDPEGFTYWYEYIIGNGFGRLE